MNINDLSPLSRRVLMTNRNDVGDDGVKGMGGRVRCVCGRVKLRWR